MDQSTIGRSPATVSFGVITDIHYAGRDTEDGKFFGHGPDKLRNFIAACNDRKVDFVACLGDFIDTDAEGMERERLAELAREFGKFNGVWHALPGNHDLETLSKREFLDILGKKRSWYSFDTGDIHFIILDAAFSPDGAEYCRGNYIWTEPYLPWWELDWLRDDLASVKNRDTIIFVHQNLHDNADDRYNIINSTEARSLIEVSGAVRAVIQGHCHRGDSAILESIPYITLTGSILGPFPESNRFAIITVESGQITIEGFGGQESGNSPPNAALTSPHTISMD